MPIQVRSIDRCISYWTPIFNDECLVGILLQFYSSILMCYRHYDDGCRKIISICPNVVFSRGVVPEISKNPKSHWLVSCSWHILRTLCQRTKNELVAVVVNTVELRRHTVSENRLFQRMKWLRCYLSKFIIRVKGIRQSKPRFLSRGQFFFESL